MVDFRGTKVSDDAQKQLEAIGFMKIGQFLWHWMMLENTVTDALLLVLDVHPKHTGLLTHFISFRARLSIIEAAISLSYSQTAAQRKQLHSVIDRVAVMYGHRNTVAHCMFGPVEGKAGINFWDQKGRKKEVRLTESFWTVEDFDEKFDEMEALCEEVETLGKKVGSHSKIIDILVETQKNLDNDLLAQLIRERGSEED